MKKLLLGIDGGGSNTSLVAADEKLTILENVTGKASNYLKIGLEDAVQNISELVNPLLCKYSNLDSVLVIGTAGAGRLDDVLKLENELASAIPNLHRLKVVSDAEITVKGAFGNKTGAILISGTGSILYYKGENKLERVGGDGRIIGDEGSAYSIGKRALNHLSKVFDGREEETDISKILITKLGIESQKELINLVYKNSFTIASVAQFVFEAAEIKDRMANNILQDESDKLINHITALIARQNINELNLALSGGLLGSDNVYKNLVIEKINQKYPKIKITEPKHKPEVGALLIAKELITEG